MARLLPWAFTGALCLTLTIPAVAETKPRKKSPVSENATPAPKKKTPKPAAEESEEDAPRSATGAKMKPFNATPAPKPKTSEAKTPEPKSSKNSEAKTSEAKTSEAKTSEAKTSEAKTPKAKTSEAKTPDSEKAPSRSPDSATSTAAPNVSIAPEEILEFRAQPAAVKKVLEFGLDLARQNLTYAYGSSDPASGGLDCSGFIYHVLRQQGFTQVPRDSSGQYTWVRRARTFRAVISRKPDSFEFEELLPGDLLFWTGTYSTDHDPPVSHVMIYLGTEKSTSARVMLGSSDGRTYRSQKRNGVSVFDFTMPRTPINGEQRSTFIGYARIPGLRD